MVIRTQRVVQGQGNANRPASTDKTCYSGHTLTSHGEDLTHTQQVQEKETMSLGKKLYGYSVLPAQRHPDPEIGGGGWE